MIIVAGTIRMAPEKIDEARPHAAKMIAATQAEAGCITYSFAEDITEPGLIRLFEAWADEAALQAHFTAPHMAEWRTAMADFGISGRDLTLYEANVLRKL